MRSSLHGSVSSDAAPSDSAATRDLAQGKPAVARGTPFVGGSLVELLRFRALVQPDDCAYAFLEDGERLAGTVSYAELERRAHAVALALRERCAGGDRALLLYPPGLDVIAAFFGCLCANVIAVPAFPPSPGRSRSAVQRAARLDAICRDAEPAAVLTTAEIAPGLRLPSSPVVIATDALERRDGCWRDAAVGRATIAFLQYTSGSTASPKGVMVTHGNLLHNLAYAFHLGETDASTVSVSWLPVVHDMGLIEGVLQPLYSGCPAYLMSPAAFLQRPLRWLQAVSRYRATRSGAPNFAYDLCVRRTSPADRATLDLRAWRAAYNGAEPVRHDTMEAFARAFAGCGFRPTAFRPSFGLAESTLLVTSQRWQPEADCQDPSPPVPCGRPGFATRCVVVEPATQRPCAADEVGEIWVAGPSVARGYWNQPAETARTFQACTADGQGPFLRTGDLGFVRSGQLYVTGRIKDILIVRGLKHYPQDIEHTVAAACGAQRSGSVAAFSLGGSAVGDRIAVAAEVDARGFDAARDSPSLIAAVRAAVADAHGVRLDAVFLVACGGIPKTTSGKLQRFACGELAATREWPLLADWQNRDDSDC